MAKKIVVKRKGVRHNANSKHVAVPEGVEAEFTRRKLAGASTQELRQYLNASGPHLVGPDGEPRSGLYNDTIVAQYISDLGI